MNSEAIRAIRSAFSAGEFAKGQRLWEAYAARLQQDILDGRATEAMLAEAFELLEWARLTVKSFRAHSADRLNSAFVARVYDHCEPTSPHLFRERG